MSKHVCLQTAVAVPTFYCQMYFAQQPGRMNYITLPVEFSMLVFLTLQAVSISAIIKVNIKINIAVRAFITTYLITYLFSNF